MSRIGIPGVLLSTINFANDALMDDRWEMYARGWQISHWGSLARGNGTFCRTEPYGVDCMAWAACPCCSLLRIVLSLPGRLASSPACCSALRAATKPDFVPHCTSVRLTDGSNEPDAAEGRFSGGGMTHAGKKLR